MSHETAPPSMLPGVLSREQLLARIADPAHPLITEMPSVHDQVQPNGVDLTLQSISRHHGPGSIGDSNTDRQLPELEEIPFDTDDWVTLAPGIYHIVYNEIVDIPVDLMALGRPRSSLARSGVAIHTAVWDAGYRGRSTSLMSVLNPDGFRVQRNARVMQLVFFSLAAETAAGYSGTYQHENAPR